MTNAEIQVGEYVRTKNGIIRKAEEVLKGNYVNIDDGFFDTDYDDYRWGLEPDEIKVHSFNLIDLIEEGDYANGSEVNMLTEIGGEKVVVCNDYDFDDSAIIYNNKRIKTIVTKEQFKSMEYEVGVEDEWSGQDL